MKKLATLALALWFGIALASEYPRVAADIEAYDQHIAQLEQEFAKLPRAPKDKEWVKAKLQHMVDMDQYMRDMSMKTPELRKYTADLKELLKIHPWFTISRASTIPQSASSNGTAPRDNALALERGSPFRSKIRRS